MAVTQTSPAWWDDCDQCGFKVKTGSLCENCGTRNSVREHTNMAYGNGDGAAYFAIVADNWQWADSRSPFDVHLWAQKESVYATLRACGLTIDERV